MIMRDGRWVFMAALVIILLVCVTVAALAWSALRGSGF